MSGNINENEWNINKYFVHANITQVLWIIYWLSVEKEQIVKHLKYTVTSLNNIAELFYRIIDELASDINEHEWNIIKNLHVKISCRFCGLLRFDTAWKNNI